MAAGGALIAGGALLLMAALGKKKPTGQPPVCPSGMKLDASGRCVPTTTAQPTQPSAQPSNNTVVNSLIGTGATLATTLATKLATSGAGGSAATTAATTTVAAATSGFFSAGPLYLAAIIIIAIAATLITQGISANITAKHYWQEKVLLENSNSVAFATTLFQKFTERATRWVMFNGEPLPAGWSTANGFQVINLSPEQLRQVGLACLYIATWVPAAKNAALVRYYRFMGWSDAQMASTPVMQTVPAGDAWPQANFFSVGAATGRVNLPAPGQLWSSGHGYLPSNALAVILGPLQTLFAAVRPPNISGNPVWDAVTKSFTVDEMRTAATQVFGADLSRLEAAMKFMGASKAVFLAAIEGYGATGGSWQTFVETLGQIFNWAPVRAAYYVTNTAQPYPLDTWWLVDGVTGNRFAPLETHSDNILRLSIKGAPILPGVPSSPLAGFGDGEGIRYNADGTTSLVSSLDPAYVEQQARAVKPFVLPVQASAEFARNIGPQTSPLLLPALGLGAAAFLFLRGKR